MNKATQPVKVMHIMRVSEGGVATVAEQLTAGLDRGKFKPCVYLAQQTGSNSYAARFMPDVELVTVTRPKSGNTGQPLPPTADRFNFHGWIETHLGKRAGSTYLFFRSALVFIKKQVPQILTFIRLFKNHDIDLIHTHSDINLSKPEIIAAKIVGIPSVCHLHAYTHLNVFDRIFNNMVDRFIFISEDIMRYHQIKGKPSGKGRVIHNGIDILRFVPTKKAKEKCDHLHIGIIGRLDWWKGHDYFIKALPLITQQYPHLRASIVGTVSKSDNYLRNKQYQQSLQDLVISLGLEDTVTFTGHRNDIPDFIAGLDILVHASSRPEPFGLVIIEGMACGKPVVATAAGGVPEIIEDNVNGVLVPCKDSRAISLAVIDLLTDRERAMRIGLAGRKTAVEKFTVDRQTRQVENLYHHVLNQG
jgi:glycosyltransferase involved in cell wall biosynthesis